MFSSSAGLARPVRMFSMPCLMVSSDFFMRASASLLILLMMSDMVHVSALDQCSFILAEHNAQQAARFVDTEDPQGKVLFPAQGQGGRVHPTQALGQRFVVGDALVAPG